MGIKHNRSHKENLQVPQLTEEKNYARYVLFEKR